MAGLRGDDNVEQVSGGIGSSLGVFHSLAVHPPVVVVLVSPGSWYVLRSIGPFGASHDKSQSTCSCVVFSVIPFST